MGGQDQFGAAHGVLRQAPEPYQANGPNISATDLDEYVDALAAAATTEKTVPEELARPNEALTTTNTKLSAYVASLIKANDQLSSWVRKLQNNQNERILRPTHFSMPPL